MFTGIIEAVQTIKSVRKTSTGVKVTVALGKLGEGVHRGDSVCVNGVCLTIDKLEGDTAHFDVMAETLRVSTVGRWKVGDAVNLNGRWRRTGGSGVISYKVTWTVWGGWKRLKRAAGNIKCGSGPLKS